MTLDDETTANAFSAVSDDTHNSSLSALRLPNIGSEPVCASSNMTSGSANISDDQPDTSPLSKSNTPKSTNTEHRRVETAETDRPASAAAELVLDSETGVVLRNSRIGSTLSEVRSRPVGIIYQSSLPERSSVDTNEDKDSTSATVSFFLCVCFNSLWVTAV